MMKESLRCHRRTVAHFARQIGRRLVENLQHGVAQPSQTQSVQRASIAVLRQHSGVEARDVAIVGYSRGAELALTAASLLPEVQAVVAIVLQRSLLPLNECCTFHKRYQVFAVVVSMS